MEFDMVEKFKSQLKDGRWPISPQGILISLDDSEDSFDSAAEEDDEEYLNGIFFSHSSPSQRSNIYTHGFHQAHINQILKKEVQDHELYAQQSAKNAAELLEEEEQEKLKIERRKEKKRKKKERKKEKVEKETSKGSKCVQNGDHRNGNNHKNNEGIKISNKIKGEKTNLHEDEKSEEDEDTEGFLDVNSAFVTKVVKHKLRSNVNNVQSKGNSTVNPSKGQTSSPSKLSSNGTRLVQIPEKNIHLGERLAVAGYQFASKEEYDKAIELFTRALRNVPNDHRYWGNRSFCYFQIGQYQNAREDADCAIQLAPSSPKGHYRRAEALAGLKDLLAAEKSFEKVLELDADCKDASDELLNIRMLQITEMGFDRKNAYGALKKYTTLEAAVEALVNSEKFEVESYEDGNLEYQSDDELAWDEVGDLDSYAENQDSYSYSHPSSETQSIEYQNSPFGQQSVQSHYVTNVNDNISSKISKNHAATDPSNPNRCVSVWVGNIEDCITEKILSDEFSRFGEILSIRMLLSSHCAFINFKDSKAPGPAMAAMQGKELAGKELKIRYPNKTKEEQHIHQQMLCHQKRSQSALSENESEPAGASGGFDSAMVSTASNTKTTLVPTPKGTRIKLKGPVNGAECYFWRTTGCAFGDNCRNKHIKENQGIDRKPWHK